jgi:hypothetical protein
MNLAVYFCKIDLLVETEVVVFVQIFDICCKIRLYLLLMLELLVYPDRW